LTNGSLATTAIIHQYTTAQRMRQAQCLRLAFVKMFSSGSVNGVIPVGMDLSMNLSKGRNVSRATARAICRGLVQHRLRYVNSIKNSYEQFQMMAIRQRNQRPGIGNDNRPTHASKAASSCSNSAGS